MTKIEKDDDSFAELDGDIKIKYRKAMSYLAIVQDAFEITKWFYNNQSYFEQVGYSIFCTFKDSNENVFLDLDLFISKIKKSNSVDNIIRGIKNRQKNRTKKRFFALNCTLVKCINGSVKHSKLISTIEGLEENYNNALIEIKNPSAKPTRKRLILPRAGRGLLEK